MKQKIMEEIMQQMLPHLDNAQLQKLEEVLEHSLFMYEISSKYTETEDDSQKLIDAFVYAKRIEGCSEKTLKYYRTTIETMTEAIDKGVRHMQTDDLRAYLTEYQEKHGSSRVTIDNIRRILSSFFSWLEDEDHILKSPVRRIHKVKTATNIKETYTDEELEKMRDNCTELRDLAIVDMLASTGMRIGEMVLLNKADINFNERECVVFGKGLLVGNIGYEEAKPISQEETVYVELAEDGSVKEVTVSDLLKQEGKENVTKEEKADKETKLPVDVTITYLLDGKEIAGKDLVGKSGKLTIRVKYTNRSTRKKSINGKSETLYTPFIMATMMVLPSDKFTNVEAKDAKVMEQGDNQIVLGIGFPGMAESLNLEDGDIKDKLKSEFEITADVKEFEMDQAVTVASADILSELDLEDNENLQDLEDSIDDLCDASGKLVKGTKKVDQAVTKFGDKFGTFAKAITKMNKGTKVLNKGSKTLYKGIRQYTQGVNGLADGVTAYVQGSDKVSAGISAFYTGVKDLPETYKKFSTGLSSYTSAVDKLADKDTVNALVDGAKGVAAQITAMNTNLETLEKSYDKYDKIIADLKAQADSCADEEQKQALLASAAELEKVAAEQEKSVAAMKDVTKSDGAWKKGADQVSNGVAQYTGGVQKLSESSSTLTSADSEISKGLTSLVTSAKTLNEGSGKLSQNSKKLLSASKKIKKVSKSFVKGGKGLADGTKALAKGSARMNQAAGAFQKGFTALEKGTGSLASGVKKFDEKGIQKIKDTYEDDFVSLKDRLQALGELSKDYTSFSEKQQGVGSEVKFIIQSPAYKK